MNGDGRSVHGTLVVKGALHQTYDEDKASGDWVTSTFSGTFAIPDRAFLEVPTEGEKVNIGPQQAPPLDYWAVVTGVDSMPDGSLRVIAELDQDAQLEEVEENEVSDEYEVLTFYGHATQIGNDLIKENRVPLSEMDNENG